MTAGGGGPQPQGDGAFPGALPGGGRLPRILVSDNRRFLMTEERHPFFWLGDTAWELFHRLTREEIRRYFQNRSKKGFTVIQACVLAECDGLHQPDRYGRTPLLDDDPTRPAEAYFQFVDEVIQMAQEYGLYIGLLPTWGDKVVKLWGVGPVIFTQENAYTYGHYLGRRYKDATNVLWILGGDRPADGVEGVWRNMAAGIKAGVDGHTFMTYHPNGGASSSHWFQDENWLDMHMLQSSHGGRDVSNWEMIARDYHLSSVRPGLDGENNYENHPVNWNPNNGYFSAYDARKQAYRGVFAGGCGHTYGEHAMWQCFQPGYDPISHPLFYWNEALDHPGSGQMLHLSRLMLSRPYFTRVPDQSLFAAHPGDGAFHGQATRAGDGSYAFVYLPHAATGVHIATSRIAGDCARAWWYDTRTGEARLIGEVSTGGTQHFTTPGDGPDWVLVLDEKARAFPAPGTPLAEQ